jgi:hypothetical protein
VRLGDGAPLVADRVDLAEAVELVATEVAQHQELGVEGIDDAAEHPLVDLEHRDARTVGAGERRRDPGGEVGAGRVAHEVGARPLESGLDRAREQPGGGGLAVGRRNECDPLVGCELLEQVGRDEVHHPAADGRALAAAGESGREARGASGTHGHPGAEAAAAHGSRSHQYASTR